MNELDLLVASVKQLVKDFWQTIRFKGGYAYTMNGPEIASRQWGRTACTDLVVLWKFMDLLLGSNYNQPRRLTNKRVMSMLPRMSEQRFKQSRDRLIKRELLLVTGLPRERKYSINSQWFLDEARDRLPASAVEAAEKILDELNSAQLAYDLAKHRLEQVEAL